MDKSFPIDSDETELIARIVTRDKQAFETLYELYFHRLYRFVYRVLGHDDGVQEVINDTLYVVWDKAAKFNGTSKVSTWIFGIAINKAKAQVAKRRDRRVGEDPHADMPSDDNWRAAVERENWLEAAMATLSMDHRTVVELTYYDGLNYREIGEIMGCPENTIKSRMFHARAKLKAALEALSSDDSPRQAKRQRQS